MKLLIVEDDIAYNQLLTRRMIKHGFDVESVTNVQQTLLIARKQLPEYVLLDMKLGTETSLPLITPLRALLPDSVIVLLTGFASIATAVEAIRLGATDYLAKPADSKTILNALLGTRPVLEIDEQPLSTEQFEWEHIHQALKTNHGNVSETARQLGMHRRTLQRKLQKKPKLLKPDFYG